MLRQRRSIPTAAAKRLVKQANLPDASGIGGCFALSGPIYKRCAYTMRNKNFVAKVKEKKMANRRIYWGIFGLLLVFGLNLAGCKTDDDDPPATAKKLTITGIDITGGLIIALAPKNTEDQDNQPVAYGYGTIANGSVTLELKKATQTGFSNDNWTGSGEYYLAAWKSSDGNFSGNPFKTLLTEKTNFSSETTTVAWGKFQ